MGASLVFARRPMEVKGWHFVGCPVAILSACRVPAQEVDFHGLTERLPSVGNRSAKPWPVGRHRPRNVRCP